MALNVFQFFVALTMKQTLIWSSKSRWLGQSPFFCGQGHFFITKSILTSHL